MSSPILMSGTALAATLSAETGARAAALPTTPTLATVLVGDDPGHRVHRGRIDGDGGVGEELRLCGAQLVEGGLHRPARKSITSDSSLVRFIGGRLCQTRRP